MALLPKVKLKAMPNFPSRIIDGAGVDVTRIHGAYRLDLAYDDFAPPATAFTDEAHQNVLLWNSVSQQYTLVPISVAVGSNNSTIYISDTPPIGAPDKALWWESDSGVLYIQYNDGSSVQWVCAVPPAQGMTQDEADVRYAPFDAMAYSGMQINGGMEVNQERGDANPLTINGYVCDGFAKYSQGSMVINDATGSIGANVLGLPKFLNRPVTTAQPSLAATDISILYQPIEGYRVARLRWGTPSAIPITIGFWTCHTRVGTYCVAIENSSRSYIATYTQNSTDTWEYKTITVPGDTGGTWSIGSGVGVSIDFTMAAGSTWNAPSVNTWSAGNFKSVAGQVNAVAATSDNFRITGVVVLPGTQAPTAAQSPLIMRPYDQELATCQRYWWASNATNPKGDTIGSIGAFATTVAALAGPIKYAVRMRSVPALTLWTQGSQNYVRSINSGTNIAFNTLSFYAYQDGLSSIQGSASLTAGGSYDFNLIANARL